VAVEVTLQLMVVEGRGKKRERNLSDPAAAAAAAVVFFVVKVKQVVQRMTAGVKVKQTEMTMGGEAKHPMQRLSSPRCCCSCCCWER
jgi:hypothetical protein